MGPPNPGTVSNPGSSIPEGFKSELYYCIIQYLQSSRETEHVAEELVRTLEDRSLFEPRYDWRGIPHPKTFADFQTEIGPRVAKDHLLKLTYALCSLSSASLSDSCSTSGSVRTMMGRGAATLRTVPPPNALRTLNHRAMGKVNLKSHTIKSKTLFYFLPSTTAPWVK